MNEIFSGVFREGKKLYTINAVKGERVYGEKLLMKKQEYRGWSPERSKLGAAIMNKMKTMPIQKNSSVLYLGASTGTTVSHVSDIVQDGIVYALEFAERVFHPLLELQTRRKNIAPLLADARKPEEYSWIEECDVIFIDIADAQEIEIFIRNANEFLKKAGYGMIAIKSQSIDVTKKPEQVYKEAESKLKKSGFEIIQKINLEPYEQKHSFVIVKK